MNKDFQKGFKRQRSFLLKDFGFKVAMFFGVSLLFFIGFKYSKEAYKQREINTEIANLQAEIEKLNQENKNLQGLIEYFQTEEFKEKETKDKLNLVKEGEKMVLVKEKEIATESSDQDNEGVEVVLNRPNYYWWWYYFFGLDKTTQFVDNH